MAPNVTGQTWTSAQMTSNSNTSGFNPKAPYNISIPQSTTVMQYHETQDSSSWMTYPTQCSLNGYQKPICSAFAMGTDEVMISPTIPQCQMQ